MDEEMRWSYLLWANKRTFRIWLWEAAMYNYERRYQNFLTKYLVREKK